MRKQHFKQVMCFLLMAFLLAIVPAPAFAAVSSYTVGTDSNETIVAALKNAAVGDTVTLTGNGTVTLSSSDEIAASVVLNPDPGAAIRIFSGRFKGFVTVNCPTDSMGVTLEDGAYTSLHIIGGDVNLKDSTVGNTADTAVFMIGGSLILSENAAVSTRHETAPAVSINGSIDKIKIGSGCYIAADRTGIATGNVAVKTIGEISVSGVLQGGYRAVSLGLGTTLTKFNVLDGGSVFANGGAGVGLENTGGMITDLTVSENASLTGTVIGVSNMLSGATSGTIISLTVAGTLSGGNTGVYNVDGSITTLTVSGKILSDRTAISNVRVSGPTMIDAVTVKSGGQLWGKGISGVTGIGIANMGGIIGALTAEAGGYIEGGSSAGTEGYGVFNCYNALTPGHIETLTVGGVISGFEGPSPGGIALYNRASTIETMTVEQTGSLHGVLAGIYNNYDQTKAEIGAFTNKGAVWGTHTLLNAPLGDATKAVIGSVSFDVENGAAGSLLRGATSLGQIAGTPIEEIVPVVQSVFSSDYKTLTATCRKSESSSDAIVGLRVQLFCLDDPSVRPIGITDGNGQVSFSFSEPFSPQGKTYWFYTLAHYDVTNSVLYSSSKTNLPAVPAVAGISASTASLARSGGSVTLTVEGTNLTSAASLAVHSDTGIVGTITPITSDTANTVTVSLPANTSSSTVTHTFVVWLNGVALPHNTAVTVLGYSGGASGPAPLSPVAPSISINGNAFPAVRIDPSQPFYTLDAAPQDGKATVTIPYPLLSGWNKQNSAFILEIRTDFASYLVPAGLSELVPDLSALLKANGLNAENISFRVTLTDHSRNQTVSQAMAQQFPGGKALGAIVDFKVEILDKNGKVISEPHSFKSEISRRIIFPEYVPSSFGAFRFDTVTKAFRFVPHHLVSSGGARYVQIASRTNSIYAVVENTVTFRDIPNGFWAQSCIEQAGAKGLVNGVGGGLFEPQRAMTRAEFVYLIMNAISPEPYQGVGSAYSDVKQGDWFYGAVEKAAALHYIPFITDGRFRPNEEITREEMAVILAAVLKCEVAALPQPNVNLHELFEDYREMNTLFSEEIRLVYQTGLMIGKGGAHFGFKETATRAEAVTVQLSLLNLLGMIDRLSK